MSYGATIFDWRMVRRSIRTECVSLLVCIVVGVAIGAITGVTELADDWPTDEMKSRGQVDTFLVALPVAFFSGLGVAVSLLDEQTNSLVGVAISASLLPPAVNAGVMWVGYAFVKNEVIKPIPAPELYATDHNSITDADADPETKEEWRRMGVLSLLLTLSNILLIWISAIFMFRMKEVSWKCCIVTLQLLLFEKFLKLCFVSLCSQVLPIKKKVFWDDLKVARKIYQRKAVVATSDLEGGELAYPEREV